MNTFNVYIPFILLDDNQKCYETMTNEDGLKFALIDIVSNQSEDSDHVRD